jgi:hypothetical protein
MTTIDGILDLCAPLDEATAACHERRALAHREKAYALTDTAEHQEGCQAAWYTGGVSSTFTTVN